MRRVKSRRASGALLLLGCMFPIEPALGQVQDDAVLYGDDLATAHFSTYDINGNLDVASATDLQAGIGLLGLDPAACPISTDPLGVRWLCVDPLNHTKLVRIAADGGILPPVILAYNPVNIASNAAGEQFVLTRVPFFAPGPMYAVGPGGSILWTSWDGPLAAKPPTSFVNEIVCAPGNQVWLLGIEAGPCGCQNAGPFKWVRVDPKDGTVLGATTVANPAFPFDAAGVCSFAGPDGSLWVVAIGQNSQWWLMRSDGSQQISVFPVTAGWNSFTRVGYADARGNVLLVGRGDEAGGFGKRIVHINATTGATMAQYDFTGVVRGFCLSGSGEELFASTDDLALPHYRMYRVNLITGTMSHVVLDNLVELSTVGIPRGDPTGFVLANVIDRPGDNDGDGATNGAETAAGSNPFDAESRPDGPKAYVSFAPGSHAIQLRFVDPDGLLHPALGLDLATLALEAGPYGNVLPLLWPFLTTATISPDGKDATLLYGALPIADNLKIRLTVSARDKTGAKTSDWQITPPGQG